MRGAPLALLETANLLGGTGNSTVAVVVPWLVLEHGSPADAGIVAAAAAIPGILVVPLVGALIDRVGRRRVSVASDILSAISVALFPLAAGAGELTIPVIAAIAILGAAFDPAGYTARKSLIPDVVRAGGHSQDRVNGVHEGVFAAGWVIGPALAAVGISTVGPYGTFWAATGAFLLAALSVAAIRVTEAIHDSRSAAGEEHERFWSSSLRGLAVLRADRPLLIITAAVALLVLIYLPTEAVLLPAHFQALDQPAAYGLTLTLLAAGAMIGAFAYGWLAARMTRHRIVVTVMVVTTVAIVPMALLAPLPIFVMSGFLLGLGWGPINPLLNALVQQRVPAHVQGRVYGVQAAAFNAAAPLGMLLVGAGAEWWGVQVAYVGVGLALGLCCLVVVTLPSLRGLDRPPAGPPYLGP